MCIDVVFLCFFHRFCSKWIKEFFFSVQSGDFFAVFRIVFGR